MPDPDLEIRGGGVIQTLRQGGGLRIRGGAPRVPPMDPPLYHDIRFTAVLLALYKRGRAILFQFPFR